jgi:hypothetical protein
MASQASLRHLTDGHAATGWCLRRLARQTPPDAAVATQGHLRHNDDLLTTLAVEAAIHHLDMIVELDRPVPLPLAL